MYGVRETWNDLALPSIHWKYLGNARMAQQQMYYPPQTLSYYYRERLILSFWNASDCSSALFPARDGTAQKHSSLHSDSILLLPLQWVLFIPTKGFQLRLEPLQTMSSESKLACEDNRPYLALPALEMIHPSSTMETHPPASRFPQKTPESSMFPENPWTWTPEENQDMSIGTTRPIWLWDLHTQFLFY